MLGVPAYTYEHRPYSATLYPTSFTLDSLLAFTISAQCKTYNWSTPGPMAGGDFPCSCMFWDERRGELTGQPMGPQVDIATIRTVLSTNRVDSRRFSSRYWAFRRTYTSADPIRLRCIRLALPLTLPFPSQLAPSTRFMVYVSPRTLWLVGEFLCDYMFGKVGEEDLLDNRWADM